MRSGQHYSQRSSITCDELPFQSGNAYNARQATAAVLCGWEAVGRHSALVAGASAPPAAVPELGRWPLTLMIGFATIRKESFPQDWLDQQRWRSLIGEFPELRHMEFLSVGSERIPAPDSAELVEDGTAVGAFIWADGQIYVDGPYSMFPLAKGIADILDASVYDDVGDEILEMPAEDE